MAFLRTLTCTLPAEESCDALEATLGSMDMDIGIPSGGYCERYRHLPKILKPPCCNAAWRGLLPVRGLRAVIQSMIRRSNAAALASSSCSVGLRCERMVCESQSSRAARLALIHSPAAVVRDSTTCRPSAG